jgi:hypothetical protein
MSHSPLDIFILSCLIRPLFSSDCNAGGFDPAQRHLSCHAFENALYQQKAPLQDTVLTTRRPDFSNRTTPIGRRRNEAQQTTLAQVESEWVSGTLTSSASHTPISKAKISRDQLLSEAEVLLHRIHCGIALGNYFNASLQPFISSELFNN